MQETEQGEGSPQDLLDRASTLLAHAKNLIDDVAALQTVHGQPHHQKQQQQQHQYIASTLHSAKAIDPNIATESVNRFSASKPPLLQGLAKLRNAIRAEARFLEKLVSTPEAIRAAHVKCSNIPYLGAVFGLVQSEHAVTHIYRVFSYKLKPDVEPSARKLSVKVDVVAAYGRRWIKVKASSMRGAELDLDESEDSSDSEDEHENNEDEQDIGDQSGDYGGLGHRANGVESGGADCPAQSGHARQSTILQGKKPAIVRQAFMLLEAARQNPIHYTTPTVVMKFLGSDVPSGKILDMLVSTGVVVEIGGVQNAAPMGWPLSSNSPSTITKCDTDPSRSAGVEIQQVPHIDAHLQSPLPQHQQHAYEMNLQPQPTPALESQPSLTHTLNIDITTLITLITDICHRFDDIPAHVYDVVHLRNQADSERRQRLLPVLVNMLAGHDLITTRAALEKFAYIVDRMGGPLERARARALFDSKDLVGTLLESKPAIPMRSDPKPGDVAQDHNFSSDDASPALSDSAREAMHAIGRIRVVENQPSDRFVALIVNNHASDTEPTNGDEEDGVVDADAGVSARNGTDDPLGSVIVASRTQSLPSALSSLSLTSTGTTTPLSSSSKKPSGPRIKPRHHRLLRTRFSEHNACVFGTGDRLRATTITANAWIERSLSEICLLDVSIWVHEPRSLVEMRFRKYMVKDADVAVAAEPVNPSED